ncbi:MAG: hypothetical protein KDD33_12445 [Bdellovibrionales bacterium]|nr:hypothetical protein [Bdellovibrionales bacterium]
MSQPSKEFDILDFASKASQVIEKNFKWILAVFVVVVIASSAWVAMKRMEASTEKEAFGELFKITKPYFEKKEEFEKATQQEQQKKPAKDKETKKDEKTFAKASGDLDKDFGDVVQNLEGFIKTAKHHKAASEAALILSDIYNEYKQPAKGAEALNQVLATWKGHDILFDVMQMRAGDLYASAKDCDKAIGHWTPIAKKESFLSQQAQVKLGVCYQEIGNNDQALMWLQKAETQAPNSPEGFNAKRYLRYIKFVDKLEAKPTEGKAETRKKESDSPS